jgi:hypothetical protein
MEPFIRKILNQGKYGLMSIPFPVLCDWQSNGFSHAQMQYDENTHTLTIRPV